MRKICVVTGSRAEYGWLYWVMKGVQESPVLELQVVVTGTHLSPEFGQTYRRIEEDGFHIQEKAEMLLSSDTPVGITKSLGLGIIGFSDALARLQPDLMVLLGDRYEILAAAQAALIEKIPIAHIDGGELTEGLIDEAIRHSITKMALYHFTSTEVYRKRVIQLGEHPDRVFNVGALALDSIHKMSLLSRHEWEESLQFPLGELNFLVTYHPVTLGGVKSKILIRELLRALDEYPQARIVFTQANADPDGRSINEEIEKYVRTNSARMIMVSTLGTLRYLSAVQHMQAVIGNSSSGIVEVPALGVPTVNIGDRQRGRMRMDSIIDCKEDWKSIQEAVALALSPDFQNRKSAAENPYGSGNAAERMIQFFEHCELSPQYVAKKFYDVESE